MYQRNSKKQLLAFLILTCFIVVSFFSFIYIVSESQHDCSGQHCPICTNLHMAENIFRQLSSGLVTHTNPISLIYFSIIIILSLLFALPFSTPITLKVKMNN